MGFVDLQVNGYGGVDFNCDGLSLESLQSACAMLRRDGVAEILATIITERLDVMCQRIARIVELSEQDTSVRQMIRGIHIEGPFISRLPGYVGAHPQDAVLPASVDVMKRLLEAGQGQVRLVTLAPEVDPGHRVTAYLASQQILVSAGHTNAMMDELLSATDAGLTLTTHLGNGCPAELPRHDNIIQRVLNLRERLTIMFIADGVHVPPFALRNYIDLIGLERCIIVTDAIAPAGLGPGRYTLGRWDLLIGEDLVARAPDGSHLVGSAMSMPMAAATLQTKLGLTDAQVLQITAHNPRRILNV